MQEELQVGDLLLLGLCEHVNGVPICIQQLLQRCLRSGQVHQT